VFTLNFIPMTSSVLQATEGCVEFRHDNGELSLVHIDLAVVGVRRIRLVGLAPEVKEKTIREALPHMEK